MNLARLLLAAIGLCVAAVPSTLAQGTGFTYQGRLEDNAAPANGSYDLRFRVFDSVSGGSQAGSTLTALNLAVTGGVFTVTLDLGPGIFDGSARWLEIAVRPGASTGAYTTLTPRQPITPAPYAIFAGGVRASSLIGQVTDSSLPATFTTARTFSNPANNFSGIGSNLTQLNASALTSGTVPEARLSPNVALLNKVNAGRLNLTNDGRGEILRVRNRSGTFTFDGWEPDAGKALLGQFTGASNVSPQLRFSTAGREALIDIGQNAAGDFVVEGNDEPRLVVQLTGNVGIGTSTPDRPLTVQGQGWLGEWIGLKDGLGTTKWHINNKEEGFNLAQFGVADARLFIAKNGNVGLGTTAPATKLDVIGDITCVAINLTSDRNAKEQFKPVDSREVLEKLAHLPITEWQYKSHGSARHIGPMAQDFWEAFGVGTDDRHITSVDADGVALAAIQGLNKKVEEKDRRIRDLEQTVAELKVLIADLARRQNGGAR